ncbi:hypothetical protein [Marinicauda algicola]|uniref:hypothetical protein n=1 Tax=Marinicauda algicola TaxID=2029849 RepID=UPI0019D1B54B|nr:hypothetical protein [Marinicauda algicola]
MKLEITLRLVEMPAHEAWGSFSFAAPDAMAHAASAMARTGLACEIFGFDPGLTAVRMQRASILSDAKTLAKVVTGQKTLLKGAREGARMALAGRNFLSKPTSTCISSPKAIRGWAWRTRAGASPRSASAKAARPSSRPSPR